MTNLIFHTVTYMTVLCVVAGAVPSTVSECGQAVLQCVDADVHQTYSSLQVSEKFIIFQVCI